MSTVEVKTADLIGPSLDWAVAQVEGVKTLMMSPRKGEPKEPFALFGSLALTIGGEDESSYTPSTCWHCGGPLVDKFIGSLYRDYTPEEMPTALVDGTTYAGAGPTYLIAACRAIVRAKLGDTVQIPAELA